MQKIGIITTSHAVNYGAVLQAYALRESIRKLGVQNVEIINYCGNLQVAGRMLYRKGSSIKNILYNILIALNFKYRSNRKKTIEYFDLFKKEKLNMEGKLLKCGKDIIENVNYDKLICGRDQIWNLNLFDDEVYFLFFDNVLDNIDCYAYSVSIAENLNKEQIKKIKERTKHFKYISVREQEFSKWLSAITDKEIFETVDPVFLLEKSEWDKIVSKVENVECQKAKYVFVFMISHDNADQKIVNRLCGNYVGRIVVLNLHPYDYLKGDQILSSVSPEQFIWLINFTLCLQ